MRLRRHTMKRFTLSLFLRLSLAAFPLVKSAASLDTIPGPKHGSPPYRGRVLGKLISPESLYEVYKDVKREYLQKCEASAWKILKSKDGVEIAIMESKGDPSCPFIRMRATMPAKPRMIWRFMGFQNWDTFMRMINPFYEGMTVLREYNYGEARMTMVRKRTTRILGFGRRDFGLVSVLDAPRFDGVYISGTFTIISPDTIPSQPGFTRAFQDSICIYKPLPNDETEMTVILRTDLNDSSEGGSGGFVPMWAVVKTLGSSGHRAIKGLRQIMHSLPCDNE